MIIGFPSLTLHMQQTTDILSNPQSTFWINCNMCNVYSVTPVQLQCSVIQCIYLSVCMFCFVFYLDLPLHGNAEEHDEVHYKYRPEHWHIEGFKKCANHGDDNALCR